MIAPHDLPRIERDPSPDSDPVDVAVARLKAYAGTADLRDPSQRAKLERMLKAVQTIQRAFGTADDEHKEAVGLVDYDAAYDGDDIRTGGRITAAPMAGYGGEDVMGRLSREMLPLASMAGDLLRTQVTVQAARELRRARRDGALAAADQLESCLARLTATSPALAAAVAADASSNLGHGSHFDDDDLSGIPLPPEPRED